MTTRIGTLLAIAAAFWISSPCMAVTYCPIMLMSEANGIKYYYAARCDPGIVGYNVVTSNNYHQVSSGCGCSDPLPFVRPVIVKMGSDLELIPQAGVKQKNYIGSRGASAAPGNGEKQDDGTNDPKGTFFVPSSRLLPIDDFVLRVQEKSDAGQKFRYFRIVEFGMNRSDFPEVAFNNVLTLQFRVGQELDPTKPPMAFRDGEIVKALDDSNENHLLKDNTNRKLAYVTSVGAMVKPIEMPAAREQEPGITVQSYTAASPGPCWESRQNASGRRSLLGMSIRRTHSSTRK